MACSFENTSFDAFLYKNATHGFWLHGSERTGIRVSCDVQSRALETPYCYWQKFRRVGVRFAEKVISVILCDW